MKRTATGFTLIEMVVVIIIVAVMAGVLVPAYGRFYARTRFDANVRDVQDVFAYAREQALAKDAPVTLMFDPGSETFAVNVTAPPPPTDQPLAFPDVKTDSASVPETHVTQLDSSMAINGFAATDTGQNSSSGTGRGATIVHFRPDGTSDAAELTVLGMENGYMAHMTLQPGNARLTLDDGISGGR
jgi:prepilin-type N-terminal cleavage/methylation domain-containing protein